MRQGCFRPATPALPDRALLLAENGDAQLFQLGPDALAVPPAALRSGRDAERAQQLRGRCAGVTGLAEYRVQTFRRQVVKHQVDDAPGVVGLGPCGRVLSPLVGRVVSHLTTSASSVPGLRPASRHATAAGPWRRSQLETGSPRAVLTLKARAVQTSRADSVRRPRVGDRRRQEAADVTRSDAAVGARRRSRLSPGAGTIPDRGD